MMQNLRSKKGFTLIELMIVVAIIAILAVVAVPQFTKYMRSAKAAEATEMLDLIKKGSASYYTTPRTDSAGTHIDCHFPVSTAITPVSGTGTSCCNGVGPDSDSDDRCDANASDWDNKTWSSLKFAITDQHYFLYQYLSNGGSLAGAAATGKAHADLDCDGIVSTFSLTLKGDPNATHAECDQVGTGAIFRENETE